MRSIFISEIVLREKLQSYKSRNRIYIYNKKGSSNRIGYIVIIENGLFEKRDSKSKQCAPLFIIIILFFSNIHQYVMNKCQSVWEKQTENKLHELKPDFNSKCSFLGYSRQIQTKITRCRIGHTRLTHASLLTNEQPPFCISCNEPFTVKHFLISYTEFNYIRKNIIPQKL